MKSGFEDDSYETPPSIIALENQPEMQERDILLSEKRKLEKAFDKLRSLYLYDDDSIIEKDYLIERKNITNKIASVDARLEELEQVSASSLSLSDEEFLQKADYFLLSQELHGKREVNYRKFVSKIDPQILKDFVNSTCSNFCIKNGRVISILLKNGIEVIFSYF